MVKGKDSSDGDVSQDQALPSTDNPSTMSSSARPKSSTSEAAKTQKKRTITRCSESDEEGIEDLTSEPVKPKTTPSKITKPKTSTTKKQVIPETVDSDHEDEEDSEDDDEDEEDGESSDDEQTDTKMPVKATPLPTKKQTSSKKQPLKRAVDSDDEDVVEEVSKPKKSKTQPVASSSSKKQTAVSSKGRKSKDSDDDIIELLSKTTKTKPKANPKQSVQPSSSSLTKKQTFKASKQPPAETDSDSDSEEDSSDEEAPNITISERKGNLFEAPDNTLLLHACNCVGSWGAGIALAFKKHYPDHFAIYKAHCESKTPNALLSTCLLIPPQPTGPKNWIGCLFTSKKYGRGKDSKEDIMDSTDSALQDMLEQLGDMENKPSAIWMCKINSGSFKVPWSQTKALIEALTFKDGLHIQVVDKK